MIDIPRETALKIINDVNTKAAYSNIALNKYLEGHEFKRIERAFITELVYGTINWQLTIDYIIGRFSSIKLNKISPWVINILRLGVYQIMFLNKVPESAACNESVTLAKKYSPKSSGFVNAVLRSIIRSKNNIEYPDKEKNPVKFLSVKYSHPEWMVSDWLKRFGSDFTEELLAANNRQPDFSVRVNTLKISKNELIDIFNKNGMETEAGKYIEEAIILKSPSGIAKLEEFKKGFFQIQDESSMLVAKIVDPKPGELVIDVCSAPGGKTTHMAQLMDNKGQVIARDVHEHKIALINEASRRLGIKIIKTELFDATKIDLHYRSLADRVLVDAPCSGLGIICRKPDIKWTRSFEDKKELVALQKKILKAASEYVKKGGTLVYSTCTIEQEENEGVIKDFISSNKDFYLEDITPYLNPGLLKASAKDGFLQLFPNVDRIDGFFISRLRRRE